jgi:hypothetical protein
MLCSSHTHSSPQCPAKSNASTGTIGASFVAICQQLRVQVVQIKRRHIRHSPASESGTLKAANFQICGAARGEKSMWWRQGRAASALPPPPAWPGLAWPQPAWPGMGSMVQDSSWEAKKHILVTTGGTQPAVVCVCVVCVRSGEDHARPSGCEA